MAITFVSRKLTLLCVCLITTIDTGCQVYILFVRCTALCCTELFLLGAKQYCTEANTCTLFYIKVMHQLHTYLTSKMCCYGLNQTKEFGNKNELCTLLNWVCASHRLACARFLKTVFVQTFVCLCVYVCVCVCPPLRLLITSDVIWTPYNWLNKFYSCYMASVVVIINGRGLGIGTYFTH